MEKKQRLISSGSRYHLPKMEPQRPKVGVLRTQYLKAGLLWIRRSHFRGEGSTGSCWHLRSSGLQSDPRGNQTPEEGALPGGWSVRMTQKPREESHVTGPQTSEGGSALLVQETLMASTWVFLESQTQVEASSNLLLLARRKTARVR